MNAKYEATERRDKQEEKTKCMEDIEQILYGHVSRGSKWPCLYFSESGQARLSSVMGWLVGLYHGGKNEVASELAYDLITRLDGLNRCYMMEIITDANEETVKVPMRKVVLHDDGSFNSFAVSFYRPITEQVYYKKYYEELELRKNEKDIGYKIAVTKNETDRHFRIPIDIRFCGREMKETRYFRYKNTGVSNSMEINYGYSHNGGFMYHGPKSGSNLFSITLTEYSGWSLHT